MAGLFSPQPMPAVPPPPPVPTLSRETIQQAATDTLKTRALAQGKASTYLTDLQTQRKAGPTAQRHLGAA